MLRGIQAFEARWLTLVSQHPTTRDDNTVIAHAMGQLIDQYQTPVQVEGDLPEHLKGLFRELAMAYFRGYVPESSTGVIRENLTPPPPRPPLEHPAQPDIAVAIEKVRALARSARCSVNARPGCRPDDPSEAETLIIEFPDGWPCPH